MNILHLSLIVLLSIKSLTAYRFVCYTTNWSQYRPEGAKFFPENIDPFLCTHVIYSFAKLSGGQLAPYEWNDETTPWMKGLYERTTDLKKINPALKVLLAVGGWTMASTDFSNMVSNPTSRRNFVTSSIDYLKKYNFDGLDLDWEYPANREGSRPTDRELFSSLVQELKENYAQHNLLVTAAVAAGKSTIDTAYEIPYIAKYLDFINIMTYDYHGSWETFTGHHTALFGRPDEVGDQKYLNIDYTVNYYISNGTPRDKINLGLATYGKSFKLTNANQNTLNSPASGPGNAGTYTREAGFLAYFEMCQNVNQGWTRVFNSQHQAPYMHKGDQWVGYDDEQSFNNKVNYIKFMNLGGAMFWAMDLDDFNGNFCGKGKYPMMNYVKTALNGNSPITPDPNTSTSSTSSTTQRVSSTTPGVSTTATNSPQVSTTNANSKCYKGDGYYADKESGCTKYYMCYHGGTQIAEFNCPPGLLFDSFLFICNYPSSVVC